MTPSGDTSGTYEDKLLAAMRRCLEVEGAGGPWWASLDAVRVALMAVDGHADSQEELDENDAWCLSADGELP